MTDAHDITGGLDLLGDWLDAKGYTEEAGLCTRAMDEINRLCESLAGYQKDADEYLIRVDELNALRAENARLLIALKPFAEQYDAVEKEFGMLLLPDDANSMVRYADLRAAPAAMGETE